jgi:hypothetical protein
MRVVGQKQEALVCLMWVLNVNYGSFRINLARKFLVNGGSGHKSEVTYRYTTLRADEEGISSSERHRSVQCKRFSVRTTFKLLEIKNVFLKQINIIVIWKGSISD